ncbi:carbohydrate ABC transporter permease [Cellulomonas bogoriensis]|uniref:Sugar ABC transporter permease n=1 Tax=Cellulomonas bogoriensis 69B4 = DSM 16987 TaxID=1386082 RepID=A0A0A0BY21_9CELL|nr:carbohydrate ABC transporter permease [Cellulomonas bogoriensis]KGM13263.1 sugar ABC transporter permease [Cellulomonas bogoriensis 69B4 = DSM 16987]
MSTSGTAVTGDAPTTGMAGATPTKEIRPTDGSPRRKAALLGRSPQDTSAGFWNYLLLITAILGSAFPLYWMFVVATGTDATLARIPPQVVPGDNFLHNVGVVLGNVSEQGRSYANAQFASSMVNSVIVTTLVTAGMLFFCSLAGFAFAKLKFKGRDKLMVIVILTLTIPNQLGVVALYIIISQFGWEGQLVSVIVPGLVTAFGVFYMRQFIQDSVPDELIESARVDGASTFRVYWNLVLPIVRPALGVLGLLTAVGTWNEFQWALIALGGTDNKTIGVALSDLASGNYVRYRIVLAGSFLATLPLILLLFVAGKQIVRGIMEGAVKA